MPAVSTQLKWAEPFSFFPPIFLPVCIWSTQTEPSVLIKGKVNGWARELEKLSQGERWYLIGACSAYWAADSVCVSHRLVILMATGLGNKGRKSISSFKSNMTCPCTLLYFGSVCIPQNKSTHRTYSEKNNVKYVIEIETFCKKG